MSNTHGSKWIRPEKRLAIYSRDGFACVYCGADEKLTLDHLQPRELGGTHGHENLVSCCLSCNSSRQDASQRSWFSTLRGRGVDTSKLSARIRKLTSAALDLAEGKRLLAART
jgi:5-methylcytosine-specific restriction endonuclease McrA